MIYVNVAGKDLPGILSGEHKSLSYHYLSSPWGREVAVLENVKIADSANPQAWVMVVVTKTTKEPGDYGEEGFRRFHFDKPFAFTMPEAA